MGRAIRAASILADPLALELLADLAIGLGEWRGHDTMELQTTTREEIDRAWLERAEPGGLARAAITRERAESAVAAIEALAGHDADAAVELRRLLSMIDRDLEDALLLEEESMATHRVFEEEEPALAPPTLLETWLARMALPDAWWAAPLLCSSVRADVRGWASLDEEQREDLLERLLFCAVPEHWLTALPEELRRRHHRASAWNRELIGLDADADAAPAPIFVARLARKPVLTQARLSGAPATSPLGPGRHTLALPVEPRLAWFDGRVTVVVGEARVKVSVTVPAGAAPPVLLVELFVDGELAVDGRLGPGRGETAELRLPAAEPDAEPELTLRFAVDADER